MTQPVLPMFVNVSVSVLQVMYQAKVQKLTPSRFKHKFLYKRTKQKHAIGSLAAWCAFSYQTAWEANIKIKWRVLHHWTIVYVSTQEIGKERERERENKAIEINKPAFQWTSFESNSYDNNNLSVVYIKKTN